MQAKNDKSLQNKVKKELRKTKTEIKENEILWEGDKIKTGLGARFLFAGD